MTSNLLSIASSGAQAAELALDITGQNISNASTDGYVRRSANMTEVASSSTWSTANDVSLSGVVVSGIVRNADSFLQSEARRTGSDTAQATATVSGLTNVETAVEDSGVFTAIGTFTNSFKQLAEIHRIRRCAPRSSRTDRQWRARSRSPRKACRPRRRDCRARSATASPRSIR